MAPSAGYTKSIKDDESTSSLLPASEDALHPYVRYQSIQKKSRWLWAFAFGVSLLLTNLITSLITHRLTSHTHRSLAEPPNGIAKIFRHLDLPPQPILINVTFYDSEQSIYRRHASLEADEAWEHLAPANRGVFYVKKEDAVQGGIDPERNAYFDVKEEDIEGYPVAVEAIHQLHCLNLIRQHLYFNHKFAAAKAHEKCPEQDTPHCGVPAKYFEIHIDHCVDFLRRRLMCTADLGIVPLFWLGKEGRTTGDMSRMHMCRNYEVVRDFIDRESTSMPEPELVKGLRPKDGEYVVWDYI